MADIGDAGPRLRQMNDVLAENDRLRTEIELLRGYRDEAEADAAVARLLVDKSRLTETEMDAMKTAIDTLHAVQDWTKGHEAKPAIAAARLMRLLDRLKPIGSGDCDRPKAIKNQRLEKMAGPKKKTKK